MLSQANDQSSPVLSLQKTCSRVRTRENSFIQLFTTNLSRIINCEISNLLSSFRTAFIIIKTYFCVAFTTGPTGKRKSSLLRNRNSSRIHFICSGQPTPRQMDPQLTRNSQTAEIKEKYYHSPEESLQDCHRVLIGHCQPFPRFIQRVEQFYSLR